MTKNDIIDMAEPYEWLGAEGWTFNHYWQLEAFAKLVEAKASAKEREACAMLCDEIVNSENTDEYINGADWCSVRIRARGEQQ